MRCESGFCRRCSENPTRIEGNPAAAEVQPVGVAPLSDVPVPCTPKCTQLRARGERPCVATGVPARRRPDGEEGEVVGEVEPGGVFPEVDADLPEGRGGVASARGGKLVGGTVGVVMVPRRCRRDLRCFSPAPGVAGVLRRRGAGRETCGYYVGGQEKRAQTSVPLLLVMSSGENASSEVRLSQTVSLRLL